MQGRQHVDTAEFYFVFFLIIRLRISLRFYKAGKEAFSLAIDVYYSITAGSTEQVGNEILYQQAYGSLIFEQHIKGVTDLAFNLNGVIRPVDAAAFSSDFNFIRAVAPGEDMYLYALILFVIEVSVYVHFYLFTV